MLTGEAGIEPAQASLEFATLPLSYSPRHVFVAGEEGIEPPSLSLKHRILADVLFPQKK